MQNRKRPTYLYVEISNSAGVQSGALEHIEHRVVRIDLTETQGRQLEHNAGCETLRPISLQED